MLGMQLLRRPLFWLIAAEVIVVGILIGAAWHFFAVYRHALPTAASAVARVPPAGTPRTPGASGRAEPTPSASPTPGPGSTRPATTLPFDIGVLNGDAANWERQQERLTRALTVALRVYVESVVVPAVERAESVRPATTPATTQSPAAIRKMP